MSGQLDAFDAVPPRFARARRGDARSSQDAAASIEASGSAQAQAERALAALRRYPGSTSKELATLAHLNRYDVARRLPELHEAGLIDRIEPTPETEPCRISHKRVLRWSVRSGV
jgi:hypothetical protein